MFQVNNLIKQTLAFAAEYSRLLMKVVSLAKSIRIYCVQYLCSFFAWQPLLHDLTRLRITPSTPASDAGVLPLKPTGTFYCVHSKVNLIPAAS